LPGGEGLEIADLLGNGRRGGNPVEVILENHVAVDGEAAIVLAEAPGVIKELNRLGAREAGKPAYNGAGEEVGVVVFAEAAAGAGQDFSGTQSVRTCVPRRSVGTINVPSWSPDSKWIAFVSYRLVLR
jgi:hypothetical protein